MPAGYASQTGYQYDSISRVAGQRELAPPSNLSKEGGCRKSVFKGIRMILTDAARHTRAENLTNGLSQVDEDTGRMGYHRQIASGFQLQNFKFWQSQMGSFPAG